MQKFISDGVEFSYLDSNENGGEKPIVFWAHGWGQTHQSFLPFIEPFKTHARHIAVDFPGFGASPAPPEGWGTQDYADAIAAWMKEQNFPPVMWVGHSFGCRVGVQMAARHPELISKLCLIAGAGLKRKRPMWQHVYFFFRIRLFKMLRRFVPDGAFKQKLMTAFGSADYKSAGGAMRKIFVRVVNEDLSEEARNINCPTALVYGEHDTETPPEMGQRYSRLIQGAKFHLLSGQDHYSVLQNGRHPVIKILSDFMKEQ